MTFEDFLRVGSAAAKRHISDEQLRMRRARREFDRYAQRMQSLGLHPLTRTEIEDRQRQLTYMERELPDKYSDTDQMRAIYRFTMEHQK